ETLMEIRKRAAKDKDAEWDDVLARVAADEDFVQQLQAAKRNKPMNPAQQKDYMSNYIKNQDGEKEKELSEEELQKLLVTVPVEELIIQPLQVKYPIIDWEVYSEDTRRYDLVKLWDLVKERFITTEPTDDKEKELWVELKRLFEPDKDDILWKLQRYMHDPLLDYGAEGHNPPKIAEQKLARKNFAGAEGPIPPKTAEQKLARKNKIKAKNILMLAMPARMQIPIKNSQEGQDKTYDRILPSAWNNIALIMRNKSDLDTLSMDDLHNNLKVYESKIKGKLCSSLNSQNVAFVSSDNFSSTNETVNTAHSISAASPKDQASTASYADDVMFSFFSNQSNAPQLAYEDLEQIDAGDLKEMDLKWKVAMLIIRLKRFIKKIRRKIDFNDKETVGFDKTKVECYNCHRRGHFARECKTPRNHKNRNRDALRRNAPVDTSTTHVLVVQDEIDGYNWIFQAEEGITNFALMAYTSQALQKQYGQQCEALNKSNLEIIENFEESSKNLTKLINSQTSAKDKAGLGYNSQMNESEVVHSVFNSRESDVDDSLVNDRFKIGEGFHAVPPLYTGNYMPSRPDLSFAGLDNSVYKTKVSKNETSISKTSKDIVEKHKTIRPSAPIIEDWDTDSDNDSVFRPKSDQTKPKFTKINFVKSDENVKSVNKENTHRQVEYPRKSQSPRDNKRNWNGLMTQKLGNCFEFIKKACFVCGSFNHLFKDCDFHDKKMVEKPVLNNKGRVTAVVTKSGQVPVNTAKQSSPRAAASISTARPVNTAAPKPKVNDALPTTYSYFKAHSLVRRAFNQKSAAKTNNLNEKVKTARVNNVTTAGPKAVVSAAVGNGKNTVNVTPPKSGSSGIVTLGCYFKFNKQDIGNDQEWTF
ncbi:ribonuclease H-like domain-containing protein, partial [Tanacetum coccineum]